MYSFSVIEFTNKLQKSSNVYVQMNGMVTLMYLLHHLNTETTSKKTTKTSAMGTPQGSHLLSLLVFCTIHLCSTSARSLDPYNPIFQDAPSNTWDSDADNDLSWLDRPRPPWSFLDYTALPRPSLSLSPPHSAPQQHGPPRLSPTRAKRLMGIFRCEGWGPGCSQMHRTMHSRKPASNSLMHRQRPLSARRKYSPSRYGGGSYGGGSYNKFEPFFALTSGKL